MWGLVRLLDGAVAQTAHALAKSKLWLPGEPTAIDLPIAPLTDVGQRGWYHVNIAGSTGPFTKHSPSATATYPALWNHNAQEEKLLICAPDMQLLVRQGMENRAAEVWKTASRVHISQDFRFNSQPLGAAFTAGLSIGGVAWPNVSFKEIGWEIPFVLWANSSLGLLTFWWHSNRQHGGRGRITISAIESLLVLDLRTLTDDQLVTAERIFEEFRDKELRPAYLADADPNRDLLDRRVVMDLLGFDEKTYVAVRRLTQKWCAEPSVHGGKARPRDARPIPGD